MNKKKWKEKRKKDRTDRKYEKINNLRCIAMKLKASMRYTFFDGGLKSVSVPAGSSLRSLRLHRFTVKVLVEIC